MQAASPESLFMPADRCRHTVDAGMIRSAAAKRLRPAGLVRTAGDARRSGLSQVTTKRPTLRVLCRQIFVCGYRIGRLFEGRPGQVVDEPIAQCRRGADGAADDPGGLGDAEAQVQWQQHRLRNAYVVGGTCRLDQSAGSHDMFRIPGCPRHAEILMFDLKSIVAVAWQSRLSLESLCWSLHGFGHDRLARAMQTPRQDTQMLP